MSHEIVYTSAPQGLKPGSKGFCTVISTEGISDYLAERLEMLSGYRHAFSPGDPRAPVNYSHLQIRVGQDTYYVLSRICDAGFDYSQRSNKLAHHVALSASERVAAGPAAVLASKGFFITRWDGQVRVLPAGRLPAPRHPAAGTCRTWKAVTGDAGWAGWLAETVMVPRPKPVTLIFRPETDTLALVAEAICLLPAHRRWDVTFNTYYTRAVAGSDCLWRFVLDGTRQADELRVRPDVRLVDLNHPGRLKEESDLIALARSGKRTTAASQSFTLPPPDAPGSRTVASWPTRRRPQAAGTAFADDSTETRMVDSASTAQVRVPELPASHRYDAIRRRRLRRILLIGFLAVSAAAGAIVAGAWYSRQQSFRTSSASPTVTDSAIRSTGSAVPADSGESSAAADPDGPAPDAAAPSDSETGRSPEADDHTGTARTNVVLTDSRTVQFHDPSGTGVLTWPLNPDVPLSALETLRFSLRIRPSETRSVPDVPRMEFPVITGQLRSGRQTVRLSVDSNFRMTATVGPLRSSHLGLPGRRQSARHAVAEFDLRLDTVPPPQGHPGKGPSLKLTIEPPVFPEGVRTTGVHLARRLLHGDPRLVTRITFPSWLSDAEEGDENGLPLPLLRQLVREINRSVEQTDRTDSDSATLDAIRSRLQQYYLEVPPDRFSEAAEGFERHVRTLIQQYRVFRILRDHLSGADVVLQAFVTQPDPSDEL